MLLPSEEVMLSYFTGLAPVGEPFPVQWGTAALDMSTSRENVRHLAYLLRRAGFIRMVNSAELAGGRGYVVVRRLEH